MNLEFFRKLYIAYPLFELLEKYKIRKDIKKKKILIYQMGKVGSSTVYETIKSLNLGFSLNHIHFLSTDGIKEAEEYFSNSESKKIPMHLRRSKLIQKYFDIDNEKIKIISLTREPIGRIVSDVFQNLTYFHPDLIDGNKLDVERTKKIIVDKLDVANVEKEFAANWFDVEFKSALGIDIYEYPFDKEKGYVIIKKGNVEILLLQMEKMNKILPEALSKFLDYNNNIVIQNVNIGEKKEFSNEQTWIKKNVSLNDLTLEAFYNTKYMKYFYSDEDIDSFKKKWLKK